MSETEFRIIIQPKNKELELVKDWLEKEQAEYDDGFYCNWDSIKRSYDHRNLILFQDQKDQPIGFMSFRISGKVLLVDIFEIHPHFRNQGLGIIFFNMCGDHFIQKGLYVAELDCSPRASKQFWEKLGFKAFPIAFRSRYNLGVFKPLVEALDHKTEPLKNTYFKLTGFNEEAFYWPFDESNNKPIVFPCTFYNVLSVFKDSREVKSEKVSSFQMYADEYLILDSSDSIKLLAEM